MIGKMLCIKIIKYFKHAHNIQNQFYISLKGYEIIIFCFSLFQCHECIKIFDHEILTGKYF